jgi:hypothetical protein
LGKYNKAYVEGYVPETTRIIKPLTFDPLCNEDPIVRPIVVRGSGQLRWQEISSLVTTSDGDFISVDTFDINPVSGSGMSLTVNGQVYEPADGVTELSESAFYVTDSTGTIVRSPGTFVSGDRFRWNGSVAGYQIALDDVLKISYEI